MQDWIIQVINNFGYFGIALMIAVENLFPPIPSEVILTFGGFMTTYTTMNVWLVALFATIGSVSGAAVLYGLGRFFNADRLERWIAKWGKILRLKQGDILKAQKWFMRRGTPTVFFCRFIPIVRSLISIPAGIAKMNFKKFLLFTAAGTAIWNIVLIQLGALMGANWEKIDEYINAYSYIAIIILAVIFIAFAVYIILKLKKRKVSLIDNKEDSDNKSEDL